MRMPMEETYQTIWDRVHEVCARGYMYSERGLQCALFREFTREFPTMDMSVEPYCAAGMGCDGRHPDLVAIDGSEITDIFELKYQPGGGAFDYREDIHRLIAYVSEGQACHVAFDLELGVTVEPPLPVPGHCRLHFVVVAHPAAAAVDINQIHGVIEQNPYGPLRNEVYLWKGRSGINPDWKVELIYGAMLPATRPV